jgi:hypothetical protein
MSLRRVSQFIYCYAEYHYAEDCYVECHYAECHYAECRGASFAVMRDFHKKDHKIVKGVLYFL